jgi:hypothetical protein
MSKLNLTIERSEFSNNCIIGTLFIDGKFECYTLELPWRENQRKISCIPEGTYKVVHRTSPKYKDHLHVTGVPNRDLILIHTGNSAKDILGCILVGTAKAKDFIGHSRVAMTALMAKAKGKTDITLTIKSVK